MIYKKQMYKSENDSGSLTSLNIEHTDHGFSANEKMTSSLIVGRKDMKYEKIHVVDKTYHKQHPQFIHSHKDVLELSYIVEGQGNYFVYNKSYPVHAGTLVICNADTVHGEMLFKNSNMKSYCCVLRDVQLYGRKKGALIDDGDDAVLYFSGVNKELLYHLYRSLELLGNRNEMNRIADKIAQAIVDIVSKELIEYTKYSKMKVDKKEKIVFRIMNYIDSCYMEQITVAELAEKFHMSESSVAHKFKKTVGISVMRYILMRRIGEAQNKLMNTDDSISDIGYQLGFGDAAHFSSSFKKNVGITPTEYRQNFI